MSLRDALGKIRDAIEDLSSLHVQTYTGTVKVELEAAGAGNKPRIETIRKAILDEAAKTNGTIKLVAEAYYQFDGDSYNFLTDETVPPKALEMHKAAVESGIKTRQGLASLVKGIFD